jgi:hypothetical protein
MKEVLEERNSLLELYWIMVYVLGCESVLQDHHCEVFSSRVREGESDGDVFG